MPALTLCSAHTGLDNSREGTQVSSSDASTQTGEQMKMSTITVICTHRKARITAEETFNSAALIYFSTDKDVNINSVFCTHRAD